MWDAVASDLEGEVLTHLHDEARASIIGEMDHEDLVVAAQTMAPEDLAVVIEDLPEEQSNALLLTLEHDHRQRLETILDFDEGTAGRLMSTEVTGVS